VSRADPPTPTQRNLRTYLQGAKTHDADVHLQNSAWNYAITCPRPLTDDAVTANMIFVDDVDVKAESGALAILAARWSKHVV